MHRQLSISVRYLLFKSSFLLIGCNCYSIILTSLSLDSRVLMGPVQEGNSPLHLAAQWGRASTVEVLLDGNADPTLLNEVVYNYM